MASLSSAVPLATLLLIGALPTLAEAQPSPTGASARDSLTSMCTKAEALLVEEVGMRAITEPDTIDDWRTGKLVPGCRVTAAGLTRRTFAEEAAAVFELARAGAWTRTPDPRDAPNEASLRFRLDEVDCLISFYTDGLLGTEAEFEVDDARVPGPGERRFNFLVMCTPEAPAVPRGGAGVSLPTSVGPALHGSR